MGDLTVGVHVIYSSFLSWYLEQLYKFFVRSSSAQDAQRQKRSYGINLRIANCMDFCVLRWPRVKGPT
ncbi:hypothetical protein GOP47_0021862 [Adiantum capillus-veneris]|uniref:Uncharacterized protein n=1 Tax=Adiantum capillus-veneris TaxID=13818 RepID=A0A9D4U8X3_ADICA|nr:hypothetical protein GOP47_0021862 [Adiantum capillus-veneris]